MNKLQDHLSFDSI